MITEDYVSFGVAKLLKEKGFNEFCYGYYYEPKYPRHNDFDITNSVLEDDSCSAPTLQMAMKWLRETFGIHCQIDCPIAASNWVYGIRDLNKDEWVTLRDMGDYDTYEEACEAGIRYVLENLI